MSLTIAHALRAAAEVIDSASGRDVPRPYSVSMGNVTLRPMLQVWTLDQWKAWHAYLTGDGDAVAVWPSDDRSQLYMRGDAIDCTVDVVYVSDPGDRTALAAHLDQLLAEGLAQHVSPEQMLYEDEADDA